MLEHIFMKWTISDGTVVHLGGKVEGDGGVALRLRTDLELMQAGRAVYVSVAPEPGGSESLNVNNPVHVNAWVADAVRWVDGASLTGYPVLGIEPVESEPDRIY
jgi:hypothetical protein